MRDGRQRIQNFLPSLAEGQITNYRGHLARISSALNLGVILTGAVL
jgi:hypothetical protein